MTRTPPIVRLGITVQVLTQELFDHDPTAEQIEIAVPYLAARAGMTAETARQLIQAFPFKFEEQVPQKYEFEFLTQERLRLRRRELARRAQ